MKCGKIDKNRNVNLFCGNPLDGEEFLEQGKFNFWMVAGDMLVAHLLDTVQAELGDTELVVDDWWSYRAEGRIGNDHIIRIRSTSARVPVGVRPLLLPPFSSHPPSVKRSQPRG